MSTPSAPKTASRSRALMMSIDAFFSEIGRGRLPRRARVRVIETDHVETAIAGGAAHGDVILRIDQKSVRARGKIAGSNGLDNLIVLAEQNPAAFRGPRTERVGDDRLEHSAANSAFHN